MPASALGQQITFATQFDADENFSRYIWIRARKDDTIKKIAARRGHPETAAAIAKLNRIRSVTTKLKQHRLIRLPGTLKKGDVVHALADDPRPKIKDGYAQYDVVARPGREGVSRFIGFNPIVFDIPIQFEEFRLGDGTQTEADIATLERMAGRGPFRGAAVGPPAVIRVSCTDNRGNMVMLLPLGYQWSTANPTAPLWRISGITWSDNALSGNKGRRVREKAVVEVTKYTPLHLVVKSAADRSRDRNRKKVHA